MSHERSSLVRDRCTSCGSLLPCVLHDRETRRLMLNESNEKPGFEKVGTVEGADGTAPESIALGKNGDVVSVDKTGMYPVRLVVNDTSTGMKFEPLLGRDGKVLRLSHGIKLIQPYRNGYLLICRQPSAEDIDRVSYQVWNLMPCHDTPEVWEMNRLGKKGVPKWWNWHETKALYSLRSGAFLALGKGYDGFAHRLMMLRPTGEDENQMKLCDIRFINDERATNVLLQGMDWKNLVPFFDDSFIFGRWVGDLRIMVQDRTGMPEDWSLARFWLPSDAPLKETKKSTSSRSRVLSENLSGNEWLLGDDMNGLHIIRPLPDGRFGSTDKFFFGQTRDDERYGEITDVERLSDDSFLLGGTTDDGGIVEYFERDAAGIWRRNTVFNSIEANVQRVVLLNTDPPSFLCFHQDGSITHWRIPPDKLRAYHERQVKQSKSPPLPSDL